MDYIQTCSKSLYAISLVATMINILCTGITFATAEYSFSYKNRIALEILQAITYIFLHKCIPP